MKTKKKFKIRMTDTFTKGLEKIEGRDKKKDKQYRFYTSHDWTDSYQDVHRGIIKKGIKPILLPCYEDVYAFDITKDIKKRMGKSKKLDLNFKKDPFKNLNKWLFTVETMKARIHEWTHDEEEIFTEPRVTFDIIMVKKSYLTWKDVGRACLHFCKSHNLIGDVYLDDIEVGHTYTTTKSTWRCLLSTKDGKAKELLIEK